MLRATTTCTFSTSELPEVVRTRGVFNILTSKRASCHNGVHFFRHLNFQKWSENGVFRINFDFEIRNVIGATTACTFSTSQLPKVVRHWCVLCIVPSKCASRHNGVHFFDISTSKSGPTLVCFVHFAFETCFAPQRRALFHLSSGQMAPHPAALASLLFDPPESQIIGKTQCFAAFLPFHASASSF